MRKQTRQNTIRHCWLGSHSGLNSSRITPCSRGANIAKAQMKMFVDSARSRGYHRFPLPKFQQVKYSNLKVEPIPDDQGRYTRGSKWWGY
jgi:hypothetical protein